MKFIFDNNNNLWLPRTSGLISLIDANQNIIEQPLPNLPSKGFMTNSGYYGASNTINEKDQKFLQQVASLIAENHKTATLAPSNYIPGRP